MADDTILWPLRAVSKDPTNLTKLDADNNVLTSTTDIDARYVIKAGDTMTGPLTVLTTTAAPTPAGHVQLDVTGTPAAFAARSYGAQSQIRMARSEGTQAAPTAVAVGQTIGTVAYLGLRPDGIYSAGVNLQGFCDAAPVAGAQLTGRFLLNCGDSAGLVGVVQAKTNQFVVVQRSPLSPTANYNALLLQPDSVSMWSGGPVTQFDAGFQAVDTGLLVMRSPKAEFACEATGNIYVVSKQAGRTNENIFYYRPDNGNLAFQDCKHFTIGGVGSLTYGFECNTDAIFRDDVAVNGNISSTGTAHSFVAGSIGSPAVIGNTPRTIAATGSAGSAGQMVWDDNFIYLRTTAGWKKVALTAI